MNFIKKNKTIKTTIVLISLLFFMGQINLVFADDVDKYGLKKTAEKAYGAVPTKVDLPATIGKIVGVVLSFLGIIFFVLIIYGGFMWMTARGNEEQVTKAKKVVINAAIGLAVILAAYAITAFINTQLQTAAGLG